MDKFLEKLKSHRENFPGSCLSTIGDVALQGASRVYSEELVKNWLEELDKILNAGKYLSEDSIVAAIDKIMISLDPNEIPITISNIGPFLHRFMKILQEIEEI